MGAVSIIIPSRAARHSKVGGGTLLGIPCREVAWLRVSSYASVRSCGIQWRRLNGEVDEEEVADDDIRVPT